MQTKNVYSGGVIVIILVKAKKKWKNNNEKVYYKWQRKSYNIIIIWLLAFSVDKKTISDGHLSVIELKK